MTQVVLYTDDMEAITVIDLHMSFIEKLYEGRYMRVAVYEPASCIVGPSAPEPQIFRAVTIWAEKLFRKGKVTWLLFTNDDEAALLLRSDVLPGQRKAFQDEFRRGFVTGLLQAIG